MAGCGHPALRTRPKTRRRGGLYGRPGRPAIPAAPPPNAVGPYSGRNRENITASRPQIPMAMLLMAPWSSPISRALVVPRA